MIPYLLSHPDKKSNACRHQRGRDEKEAAQKNTEAVYKMLLFVFLSKKPTQSGQMHMGYLEIGLAVYTVVSMRVKCMQITSII